MAAPIASMRARHAPAVAATALLPPSHIARVADRWAAERACGSALTKSASSCSAIGSTSDTTRADAATTPGWANFDRLGARETFTIARTCVRLGRVDDCSCGELPIGALLWRERNAGCADRQSGPDRRVPRSSGLLDRPARAHLPDVLQRLAVAR